MSLPALVPDLAELGHRAAGFARAAKAPNTQRAYRAAWADFAAWCESVNLAPLPAAPAAIGAYLTARAGLLKTSTLAQRLAAIRAAHRASGHYLDAGHPAIVQVMTGIRRTYGTHQDRKTALLTEDLRRMVRRLPATPAGIRDRAVLLTGFAGAFRRSELVALNRDDLVITHAGLTVTIRRSKTDQEGQGREVGIPRSRANHLSTCPVAALEAWLELYDQLVQLGGQTDGPVFLAVKRGRLGSRLTGKGVAEIVKQAAGRVGIDPRSVAGHSLRSGFATSAARGGADLAWIMMQTGHKNADVARRYVQQGQLLQNPASKAVRL